MANSEFRAGWVRKSWPLPTLIAVALIVLGAFLSEYLVYVATSWIAFGMVALGLSLVWSKAGDLSLGHTVFFGLGAYAYGIIAINLGPYLGGTAYQALLLGLVVGGVSAAIVAYFLFYGRLGPLQVTIITYTLVLLAAIIAVGLSFKAGKATVGGANGMSGIPPLSLSLWSDTAPLSRYAAYCVALVICTAAYVLLRRILSTTFGLVINGIRQNILRTELLGYDVRRYRLILFTISGAIAGVGGALYAAWASYISPSVFSVTLALFIPIYVLVGGLGWLSGAFVGTLVVGGLSFWLGSGVAGGQTALILGAVLILLVLFAPKGLLGIFQHRAARNDVATPTDEGSHKIDTEYDISQLKNIFGKKPTGETIFEICGLNKRYGGVVATDNVSLAFADRGIHCLIGPNGAGKSTLLNTCLGLLKPDSGQVLFHGTDITGWEPYRRVKAGLGIKLQVARILEEIKVRENLWLAAYGRLQDKQQADALVEQVIRLVGLATRAHVPGGELSHGEQQWLDLGMVLCLAPTVILLDEPAAGMTQHERQQMVAMLREISDFASIIVVEHDMDFVRSLDAPVTVLHQGAVFATGSIHELRQDSRVLDIYLGRRHDA